MMHVLGKAFGGSFRSHGIHACGGGGGNVRLDDANVSRKKNPWSVCTPALLKPSESLGILCMNRSYIRPVTSGTYRRTGNGGGAAGTGKVDGAAVGSSVRRLLRARSPVLSSAAGRSNLSFFVPLGAPEFMVAQYRTP